VEGAEGLSKFVGETVVIDTRTPLVYMGRLTEVREGFAVLENVDVHDIGDTHTTKEVYILEARKFGVKKNRRRAHLSLDQIVSISKLEDIIEY
jgi:hypothetical protein